MTSGVLIVVAEGAVDRDASVNIVDGELLVVCGDISVVSGCVGVAG